MSEKNLLEVLVELTPTEKDDQVLEYLERLAGQYDNLAPLVSQLVFAILRNKVK